MIRYLPEPGDNSFNLDRARNLGAADKPNGWLCFLDADFAAPGAGAGGEMVRARIRPGYYFTPFPGRWGMSGSCIVEAEQYHRVGGYDELYRGWGCDDIDFYLMLRTLGVRPQGWDDSLAEAIQHSDAVRTQFQDRNKTLNHRISAARLLDQERATGSFRTIVCPVCGSGKGSRPTWKCSSSI